MKETPLASLIKSKEDVYKDIKGKNNLLLIGIWFVVISLIGLAIFGATMGTVVGSLNHSLLLSWKTILLVWGPMLICTPSLYVFGSVSGSRLTVLQLLLLQAGAMATSAVVLLALTPLTWFFTWTSNEVDFLRLMNAFFIGLGLAFGMFFFSKGVAFMNMSDESEINNKSVGSSRINIVALWFVLLIVVVAQMSGKLGPWYEETQLPIEYKIGNSLFFPDMYFPKNPVGEVVNLPQATAINENTSEITWELNTRCTNNSVELIQEGYTDDNGKRWGGTTADCTFIDSNWSCKVTAPVTEYSHGNWRAQAHGEDCASASGIVVSQPVTIQL